MKIQDNDQAWAHRLVADIPPRWRRRLLRRWERVRAKFDISVLQSEGQARQRANEGLLQAITQLEQAPLALDASDAEVCAAAEKHAQHCRQEREAMQHLSPEAQRAELARICDAIGVSAPDARKYQDGPAMLRLICPQWWRRQLRKAQARAVEGSAISLGYVNKVGDCYVSDESVQNRLQQNARNAAMLEATIARNELGQEFTLAELAAKGPANKSIRRAELMTRINGFERVAIAAGHTGLFFTMTCPSRMHAYRTVQGGRVIRNKKYDGTKPNEAQAHLTTTWARIRASLGRRSVGIYGFRIAEPNHDGTPHWHCLVFHRPGDAEMLRSTISKYALAVDGDEPGARKHRVDFKPMDAAKGTAAGYIAKYVAKNIDGYRLEKDLIGNDAIEASARVEAWATRWRIRQFQQIGGPPVSVWRELRRVESVPTDAPAFLRQAHNAVNRVAVFEGRDNASVAWNHYCDAQGGVFAGRDYRIRLSKIATDQVGRYGEEVAPRVIGIEYFEQYKVRDAIGNWTDVRPMTVTIESKRHEWEILRPASSAISVSSVVGRPVFEHTSADDVAPGGYAPASVDGLDFGFQADEIGPWTCVNNCTRDRENETRSSENNTRPSQGPLARRDYSQGRLP
ncbi:replication endonuclease [Paraburkholderia metrosideri]|uniref:Replication endonuclease n=1 Tax=Paraburkholderia metrosideri TaxID=580937 RepID=A0ABW9E3A1_9BURK